MAGLILEWFMRPHALFSAWLTDLVCGVCMCEAEPQFRVLGEHTSIGRSGDSPLCGSVPMTCGKPLRCQPLRHRKVCNGSLSPSFSTFRTRPNSGFDAGLLPLHVEETFQSSTRQSTNANAVFDLVHGASVNTACTDYGLTKLDSYPLDWEGQMGPWNVASSLLGFGCFLRLWSKVEICCPSEELDLGSIMPMRLQAVCLCRSIRLWFLFGQVESSTLRIDERLKMQYLYYTCM